MCGRITLREPQRAVAEFLGVPASELPPSRFNIGPGQETLIVRVAETNPAGRELCRLDWGFVPSWNRKEKPAPIINARSETVAMKPSFRDAFRHRRCLLLADGFYEWQRRDRERQPFFCTLSDGGPFAIAAIWEEWKRDDRAHSGFCLLTTEPNSVMEPVHDRMPVLLDRVGADRWIAVGSGENLNDLLRPFSAEKMEVRPVSSFVNKIGNEGPRCIEGPEEGNEQLAFF